MSKGALPSGKPELFAARLPISLCDNQPQWITPLARKILCGEYSRLDPARIEREDDQIRLFEMCETSLYLDQLCKEIRNRRDAHQETRAGLLDREMSTSLLW